MNKSCLSHLMAAVVALATIVVSPAAAQQYEKLSPFTQVEVEGDVARVRYDGKVYELIELNGLEGKSILDFACRRYAEVWEKRFAEDLVEVLTKMGKPPGRTVRLGLRDASTGKLTRVAAAPMTEANRNAVWAARREAALGRRPPAAEPRPKQLRAAVAAFEEALATRWSYLKPSGLDPAPASPPCASASTRG